MEKSQSRFKFNHTKDRKLIILSAFLIALAFTLNKLYKSYNNIITSYSVLAKSERVDITTYKELSTKWSIEGANIYDLDGFPVEKNFRGTIDVFDSVKIEIERIGSGNVFITLYSLKGGPIITYTKANDDVRHKDTISSIQGVSIEINDIKKKSDQGLTHTFPFSGKVELGRIADEKGYGDGSAVLRSGEINMLGKNEIEEDAYFQGETEKLRTGDKLIFPDNAFSVGIININEEPCMTINYRTESKEAWLIKPGMLTNKYKISVSIFDQWRYDKDYQRISMLIAVILVFFTTFTFIFDLTNFIYPKEN